MFIPRFAHRLAVLCLLSGTAIWPQISTAQPTAAQLGSLPLAFVRHGNQFSARGQGYLIGLNSGAATIQTLSQKNGGKERFLSIAFPDGRNVAAVPGQKLKGVVNYITGNDPHKWQIGLPTMNRVTYPEVYPGIDVVYYGNQQQLEFDLVVKPGADPRAIRMKIQGGGKLSIDQDGALEVADVNGLRIGLPKIYQEVSGVRKNIAGHFSIRGTDEIAFRVDAWDRTRPLIIDPTIVYSRLLSGGLGASDGTGIAVDASGNVLVTGYTTAADFPRTNSASATSGGTDGFISKLNSDGTALIYSTVFGGSQTDTPNGLAVDSTGAAWVTGTTSSADFPLTGSGQSDFSGAFVLKVDNAGVSVFSAFVGFRSTTPYSIAVDPAGNSYVTGSVSAGFPTTPGVVQPSIHGQHAFVSKYSPSGAVLYATLLGGTGQDVNSGQDYGYGIAADSHGDAYVTGMTSSPNFVGAPAGGAQTTNRGNNDAFVAKLNSDGSALLYFTFLGGSGSDQGSAITVDASLNAYVTGQTNSADLPVSGAAQAAPGGYYDAFVAKVNPSGNAFSYMTWLGGSRRDYAKAIATDQSGNVYVTGSTESADFPLVSPVQQTIAGNATSLFSSTDGGATWAPADSRIPGRVYDISMNPAGTSALAITESGIYRTTDGGSNWTQQFSAPSGVLLVSRSLAAPSTIYAACGAGVCRSTDDGVTWSSVAGPTTVPVAAVVADPLVAGTVYVKTSFAWMKSTDSGASWSVLPNLGGTIQSMIGAPDGALYAVVRNSSTQYPDLYKSTNQGGRWSPLNLGLPFSASFSSHQLSAVGNGVYFAAFLIYQTTNGGKKFTSMTAPEAIYEVEVSPQDSSVQYALGASGYVLKSVDGGATWSATSQHLSLDGVFTSSMNISHIVIDPANPSHVFAISPVNNAVFAAKLNSDGKSLAWSTFLGGSTSATGLGIAADGSGDAFITGISGNSLFPATGAPLSGSSTNTSAFITKISDAAGDCAPLLNANDQTISGKSQTLQFGVVAPSGCNWSASSDADWAAITSGASTTGTSLVTVQVVENDGVTTRTATLKAGNSTVKITQTGNSCSYSLDTPPSPYSADPPEYIVPPSGGTVTAVLTATAGCPWTVVNPYPAAVTITSGSSGTGSGTIQLTVAPSTMANLPLDFFLPVGTAEIEILQFHLSALDQSITFTAIPDQTLDFDPPPLAATASSNLPVTFTSGTPSVCSVSDKTVTLITTGTCSITANQAGNALWLPAAPVTQTFAVTAGPAVPQAAAIVNAASSNVAPAAGGYVAIYGHALAGHGNASVTALPLPTSLNGTQVTLGGLPMPLLYAASGQINALLPMRLTPNQSYPLVVTRDGIPSSPLQLKVGPVQPAIYSVNATGNGAGVVTNSLTGQLITQDNPAAAGDFLTIYCNGLGSVHGPNGEAAPNDGAAAPLDVIYSTDAKITASLTSSTPGVVFTVQPTVLFSGLTPSLAGLYQVNVQVPYIGEIYGSVAGSLTIKAQPGSNSQSNQVYIYVH